jgi:2-polyprenyl-6-methoxyphenol hydroxylase-like FAD-dependent oxidoreductase
MTDVPGHVDVLVVGSGPVGLSLAIELGSRGITCLVVEKNDRVGYNPRAKTTNVRSREHMRRWGVADKLRAASPIPADYPPDIVFATRMNGPELARFDNAFNASPSRNNLYSESAQWVPQYVVEEVLRDHAQSLAGVTVRFNVECTGFEQSDDDVVASLVDLTSPDRAALKIRASYLVGADGARSAIREGIGARMTGAGGSLRNLNIVMRAPGLDKLHRHGPAIHYWLVNEDVPSVLGPMDRDDLWYFIATKIDPDANPGVDECKDLIRRSTGIDFEPEIVGVDPWVARSLIADIYRDRRVFLAGDACHLHPPFGGFGMNMGIGDAVDLGWKLAANLQGWGGLRLLDSYEIERRQVHLRTIEEATINYAAVGNQLVQPFLEDDGPVGAATREEVGEIIRATKIREFRTLGIVLGYRYRDSPVIAREDGPAPQEHFMLYVPTAYPGCLAPHLWLADGSSLYDQFGPGFTLLVTEGTAADGEAAAAIARARDLPLTIIAPDDARLRARYGAKLVLIRPDQHVAWRGDIWPEDLAVLIGRITGH